MAYAQLTKIVLSSLGEPKTIVVKDKSIQELMLGTIYGRAESFIKRKSPDQTQEFEGLSGLFRAIPCNLETGEIEDARGVEATILFLGGHFHNQVADALRAAQLEDSRATLDFIYDIYVIRATNPQGYSWKIAPQTERPVKSPLDALMVTRAEKMKQLAAPPSPKAANAATGRK